MKMEKRGELGLSDIIFIVLNVIFFAILLIFVVRAGNSTAIYEEMYAKKFALMIDSAKPGMVIHMNIEKLNEVAKKNHYNGKIVEIKEEESRVIVRLASGQGYSFQYFSKLSIKAEIAGDYLKIEVGEK